MANYSKPQVTIDLEEYQELIALRNTEEHTLSIDITQFGDWDLVLQTNKGITALATLKQEAFRGVSVKDYIFTVRKKKESE